MSDRDKILRTVVVFVRSTVFHISSFSTGVVYCVALPFLFLPRQWAAWILESFFRVFLWQLKTICGLTFEVHGAYPVKNGPVLIASKHQSAWETVALAYLLNDPVFIVKRELFWVPVIGWVIKKMGHIGVQRKSGLGSVTKMLGDARKRSREGRDVVIFPEGTRGAPSQKLEFKQGIGTLYRALNVPCVPVALNSGLFWPRRSWLRYPGTIMVLFLEPIQPGLDMKTFMSCVEQSIEGETQKLVTAQETSDGNLHSENCLSN